jgi:hypothetical protein
MPFTGLKVQSQTYVTSFYWDYDAFYISVYHLKNVTSSQSHTHKPELFKLWSADHKWSSGSALVVLGLTFYEINYPAYKMYYYKIFLIAFNY